MDTWKSEERDTVQQSATTSEFTTMPEEIPKVTPVQPMVPIMSRDRFAELVGVTDDTVRGWMNSGYIPTLKVGRHRVVNIQALMRECQEKEEY